MSVAIATPGAEYYYIVKESVICEDDWVYPAWQATENWGFGNKKALYRLNAGLGRLLS